MLLIKRVVVKQYRKQEHLFSHSPLIGIIHTYLCYCVWMVLLTGVLCYTSFSQVPVAQWLACWTSNSKVVGSSPTRDAFFKNFFEIFLIALYMGVVLAGFLGRAAFSQVPVAQWLACWTSNSKVVGSSPTRDAFFFQHWNLFFSSISVYTWNFSCGF